ncbi:MAG: hypothetical protein QHJ73_15310, partial [Armatimonadota bacterium]|nr:hypothetical protein [Armatimonadota bacterium]
MTSHSEEHTVRQALQEPLRLLRRGRVERAIRALLLWPDRVRNDRRGISFGGLWQEARAEQAADPVEESVLRFVEGVCAYRAGKSWDACNAFVAALEASQSAPPSLQWVLRSAVNASFALALRRS